MPVLAESELEKLAGEVVDQYLAGQTRLDEAAAKMASARGLNHHQIERLTHAANTQTFLRLMDQRKQAQEKDLLHEFEPIDAHIDGPGEAEECHCDDKENLPDEMGPIRKGEKDVSDTDLGETAKAASARDAVEENPSPREKQILLGRLQKLAAAMQDEIQQSAFVFEEKFDALVDVFRRRPEKYASFERDACMEHGDVLGRALVGMLRGKLRMGALPEKTANQKTADFHVSDDTPAMAAFEGLLDVVERVNKLNDGVERIKARCAR
jgi:hypothetical protein